MGEEKEIPDFVSRFSGRGFETKPGIQFTGAIKSTQLQRGERTYLLFVLQNALDAAVEGEIRVTLPSSKMFKNTNLSTISPVPFTLKGTEVEKIEVPIQSSLNTPEGRYEVNIEIKGKGGEGGNRVRGRKEGKQWGKAAAKSVASSVALSAVGMLFGGAAVRVYAPSDNLKTSFTVTCQAGAIDESPLHVIREKLWDERSAKIYVSVSDWVGRSLANWKGNEEMKNQVTTSFIPRLRALFQAKQIEMSDEELLWLGRLLTFAAFDLGFVPVENLAITSMNQVNSFFEGKEMPETVNRQSAIDFEKDVIKPWLTEMTDQQFCRLFAFTGAIYMAAKLGKVSDHAYVKSLADQAYSMLTEDCAPEKLMNSFNIYFVLAVAMSKSLFSEGERATHLRLLADEVKHNRLVKEEHKRRIVEMVDKLTAVKN